MSYIVPSVLVSQALATSAGVANSTPDLACCIIGPAYNVLSYVPGDSISQAACAAVSAISTTGSITASSNTLTVASTGGFSVGNTIIIAGAGASGVSLQTTILSMVGNIITISTTASTTVTGTTINLSPVLTRVTTNTSYFLPGAIAGQVVDTTVVPPAVWLSNASVATFQYTYSATTGSNTLSLVAASTSASSVSTTSVTVGLATGFNVGDNISITGTGASSPFYTTVVAASGTSMTIATAPGSAITSATITQLPLNFNPLTNTLRVQNGNTVVISHSGAILQTSSIQSISTTAGGGLTGLNASVTEITLNDTYTGTSENVLVTVIQTFNDVLIPLSNPLPQYPSLTNYTVVPSTSITPVEVQINADISTAYGPIAGISTYPSTGTNVYIAYRALRTDLANQVLTFSDLAGMIGALGSPNTENPLSLAVSVALSNTAGNISAIAVGSDDSIGHSEALTASEAARLYFLVPLTRDPSILALYETHVTLMSTPVNAAWRIALVNTLQPSSLIVTSGTSGEVTSGGAFTDPSGTFIGSGVNVGDSVVISGATYTITAVLTNQSMTVGGGTVVAVSSPTAYTVNRALSKTQIAEQVALVSSTYNNQRIVHVQPDSVSITINGVSTPGLPGYYLAAALGGMGAGYAVQQGFTNIVVAGIADLQHSNYYFGKSDLNNMAAAGTCLFVQNTQGGTPYCRHELTTNMTTLSYRELVMVKELDYLSYYYYDVLKGFIGGWNITPSTLNTIRQTLVAGSELIMSQGLPQIGAVLLGYQITNLSQDPVNTDTINCTISVAIGTPLNYIDITLVV